MVEYALYAYGCVDGHAEAGSSAVSHVSPEVHTPLPTWSGADAGMTASTLMTPELVTPLQSASAHERTYARDASPGERSKV